MKKNKKQALLLRAERLQQNSAQKSGPPFTGASNQRTSKQPFRRFTSSATSSNQETSTSQKASRFRSKNKSARVSTKSNYNPKVTGKCSLITKERFEAEMSSIHNRTVELFNTLPSANYDSQCKKWSFHIKEHEILRSKLKEVAFEVSIGYLPDVILNTFQKLLLKTKQPSLEELARTTDLSCIDPVLLGNLMPFQKEGVCFGVQKEGRCMIADDMGLGKTIQALGIAHYFKDDWPLLIVTPSSVRCVWEKAIKSWLPSVAAHEVVVMTSGADDVQDARVLIVSYGLLSGHKEELKKMHFGAVILDESHYMKNMKTARTKACLALVAGARRVLLLTGTPALSRPVELYPQLEAISPGMFPRFSPFGIRYCDGKKGPWGWNYSGSSNLVELQLLLETKFMIRRLKADVLTQLPDKNRQMIVLNSDSVKIASKNLSKCEKLLQSSGLGRKERMDILRDYYVETGKAKLKAVQNFIRDLIESGQKFICFAHHRQMIDGICQTMTTKGKKYIHIDGSTAARERQELCDSFQTNSTVVAAILSITAANTGITLTAANLVVFAELFWNPGTLIQAEDRAHRIGQRDCVTVKYLVARGTADDYIWQLIIKKLDILNKVGLSKDDFLDSQSVQPAELYQSSIEGYFEELPENWFDDGADSWLTEIDIKNLVKETSQQME